MFKSNVASCHSGSCLSHDVTSGMMRVDLKRGSFHCHLFRSSPIIVVYVPISNLEEKTLKSKCLAPLKMRTVENMRRNICVQIHG